VVSSPTVPASGSPGNSVGCSCLRRSPAIWPSAHTELLLLLSGKLRLDKAERSAAGEPKPCVLPKEKESARCAFKKDYLAFGRHLAATMEKFNMPQSERSDVMNFIASLESDIVEA
jgi:hypothetical protein